MSSFDAVLCMNNWFLMYAVTGFHTGFFVREGKIPHSFFDNKKRMRLLATGKIFFL